MSIRAGNIGTFVFDQSRRGSLRNILLIGAIILSLMLYVAGKISIVRLGYQIEALEQEKVDVERANRSLRIEASSLAAPGRIEEIAVKRMGMIRPQKENIVIVKRRAGEAEAASAGSPGK